MVERAETLLRRAGRCIRVHPDDPPTGALESLSWRTRYLALGEPVAWCAVSYEHRHEYRCMAFVVIADALFGVDHCAASWAWWGVYSRSDTQ